MAIEHLFKKMTVSNNDFETRFDISCARCLPGDSWKITGRSRPSGTREWTDAQDWSFNCGADNTVTYGMDGQPYPAQ